ncbi:Nucleotide-binding alpha-beta plait [Penicillium bovifimosum]|uniref:Nucleotide-binding alpha-beta plait n=1 Tax=Penicillium bovifimosum TaxID=126998 RepID=A0A9W9GV49_9EURO|nr:Nucleotide-binding alpha-beta plait [Penicillium bovifimosum]KAJ5130627.1 Nucleotide-binding alpha-beta plait [Penicillium bovifimosum]
MTPSPPDEALHFRGKTLTPESPRPLHIPEPANIPVLENQMDPVFNDTSTYEPSVHNKDGRSHKQDSGQAAASASFPLSQPSAVPNEVTVPASYYPPNQASASETSGYSGSFSVPDSHSHPAPAPISQGFATANEVEHAHPEQSKIPDRLNAEGHAGHNTGVNFQSLLDHISQPNPGATLSGLSSAQNSSFYQAPINGSIQAQGIPAHTQAQSSSTQAHYTPIGESSTQAAQNSNPSDSSTIAPGAPAHPTPSTGAESQGSAQEHSAALRQARSTKGNDEDSWWGPEVQKKYDEFLHDERIYVTEGLWDRFPMGSRLFVGNLPTERVTKRDMFHLFHKYGKLAQISIKQAYGFIQFLEASSCRAALDVEQGAIISRSRSHSDRPDLPKHRSPLMHHLVRDPPNSAAPGLGVPMPGPRIVTTGPSHMNQVACLLATSEMSRLIAVGGTTIAHHGRLLLGHFEDIGMGIGHARELPKDSIVVSEGAPDHVLHDPLMPEIDVPRRGQRDVPDVQILVLEELDRNFILHVENAFRNRGLRVDVLVLGPRIPLGAAVHRQFIEGVLAVVRLARPNQVSRKIPLQLFDRTAGLDNVRFLDYPELEPNMSAELLSHQAHAMQRGAAPTAFAPNPAFVGPSVQPVPPPGLLGLSGLSNPPNIANLIGSLDGPSLSSLLSALQRPPLSQPVSAAQSPFSSPNLPSTDLASLLSNAHRPPSMQSAPQQPLPHPSFNIQPSNAPVITDANLLSLLAKGLGGQQPQGQAPIAPQVQNLMQHLAKWKQ